MCRRIQSGVAGYIFLIVYKTLTDSNVFYPLLHGAALSVAPQH